MATEPGSGDQRDADAVVGSGGQDRQACRRRWRFAGPVLRRGPNAAIALAISGFAAPATESTARATGAVGEVRRPARGEDRLVDGTQFALVDADAQRIAAAGAGRGRGSRMLDHAGRAGQASGRLGAAGIDRQHQFSRRSRLWADMRIPGIELTLRVGAARSARLRAARRLPLEECFAWSSQRLRRWPWVPASNWRACSDEVPVQWLTMAVFTSPLQARKSFSDSMIGEIALPPARCGGHGRRASSWWPADRPSSCRRSCRGESSCRC